MNFRHLRYRRIIQCRIAHNIRIRARTFRTRPSATEFTEPAGFFCVGAGVHFETYAYRCRSLDARVNGSAVGDFIDGVVSVE